MHTETRGYAEMKARFDKVTPWRGSDDRPWGNRKHSTKRMRMLDDGSIEFEYRKHTFVTWHPDNTLTLCTFSRVQQAVIWDNMLPAAIVLRNSQARVGSTVMVCPADQIKPNAPRWYAFPFYAPKPGYVYDNYGQAPYGNRMTNPDVLVFKAEKPTKMHYCAERKMWLPVDEAALEPFKWQEIDKKATRKLNEQHRLTDFVAAVNAIASLRGELPEALGVVHNWRRSGDEHYLEALQLIERCDFVGAMAYLRRTREYSPYVLGQGQQVVREIIMSSEYGHMRTVLYKREGALIEHSEKILTLPQFEKVRGLLYRFE